MITELQRAASEPVELSDVPWFAWGFVALTMLGWVFDYWARHPDRIPRRLQEEEFFMFLLSRGLTTVSALGGTVMSLILLLTLATGGTPTGWVRVLGFLLFGVIGLLGLAWLSINNWRRPRFLIPYAQRTEEERRR